MSELVDIEGQLVVETEYRAQVRAYRKPKPGEVSHSHNINIFSLADEEISVGGDLTAWQSDPNAVGDDAYALAFGFLSTGAEWVTITVEDRERVTL